MKLNKFLIKTKSRVGRLFTKSNRNLLFELIRAEFKVRDHNTILGVFWSLLGPLAMLLVMYFIFRTRFGQEVYAYPLHLLVGIISVSFFITTTTYMIKLFFVNRELLLNSTVPRENVIISTLVIHTYKFIIELIFCYVLSIFYGVFAWKSLLLLLPLLVAYTTLVLGIGLVISLIYCFARDIEHIWMIASRLLFFATPIFYVMDKISPWAQKLIYWGNPLTPFLISFRQIIMRADSFSVFTYLYSLLLGGFFFTLGCFAFIVFENIAVERV